MTTLVLSTLKLTAERSLADAARRLGWKTLRLDEEPDVVPERPIACYVSTDAALMAADRFQFALLEPPLDLLARIPKALLHRTVEFARFRELHWLRSRVFVKPADPLNKCFDAGVYTNIGDIRNWRAMDPNTPVLIADPVDFVAEYRCFVLNGEVVTSSPYVSFGRPIWKPWGPGGEKSRPSKDALAVCARLFATSIALLPPAFVVDVGFIEGRGWGIVEFNPAWSSGLLGTDPSPVLGVLARACQDVDTLSNDDRRWVVNRKDR